MPKSSRKRKIPRNKKIFKSGAEEAYQKKHVNQHSTFNMTTNITLFCATGEMLASFSQNQPFKIDNKIYEAHIQSDGLLYLSAYIRSDTRTEAHKEAVMEIKNELSHRKKNLLVVESEIATLLNTIQGGKQVTTELSLEMDRMLLLKSQHTARICELENQTTVSFTYQKIRKIYSALLPQGVFTKLSWFSKPVMWCTEIREGFEENKIFITEEIPIRTTLKKNEISKGHLYVVCGIGSDDTGLSSVERYDPDHNKWTFVTMLSSKRYKVGTAILRGQLYTVGGKKSGSPISSVQRYNPIQNKWTSVSKMNSKRMSPGVAVVKGQIYVIGGHNGSSILCSGERYDPEQDKWTIIASMNCKRSQLGIAVLGGQLYAVGGRSISSSWLSSMERYDPQQDTWTFIAPMNCQRGHPGVAVIDDQIYAVAGWDGSVSLSSVERYDPHRDKWTFVAPLDSKRRLPGVGVIDRQLYAIGGYDGRSYLSSVERYDPDQNEWTAMQSMNSKRGHHGVAVFNV